MASEGPRHALVTQDDHGPIIQIASWFTMISMILMTGLRLAIRFAATRNPGLDDAVCLVATLFSIGSTIAVSRAVTAGLGEKEKIRNISQTSILLMNEYAESILYILTIVFAKLSVLVLIRRLSSKKNHKQAINGLIGMILLWGVASFFADCFRCKPPKTWDLAEGDCFDIYAFWDGFGAIDILTDVLLIAIPLWLFGSLQMKRSKKMIVFMAFACRIVVVVAAICRLFYLHQTRDSSNFFFDSVNFHVCTQVQEALTVIVASAPTLKNFVERTESGMLNVSLSARHGSTTYGMHSANMTAFTRSRASRASRSRKDSSSGADPSSKQNSASRPSVANGSVTESRPSGQLFRPEAIENTTAVTSNGSSPLYAEKPDDDMSIQSHSDGNEKMVINVKKDWRIDYSGVNGEQ